MGSAENIAHLNEMIDGEIRRLIEADDIHKRAMKDHEQAKSVYSTESSPDFNENFEAAYRMFTAQAVLNLAAERYDSCLTSTLHTQAMLSAELRDASSESKA